MPPDILNTLSRASAADIAFLDAQRKWHAEARHNQMLPLEGWTTTLAMAGRGFGKTRVGAEWIFRQCGLYPGIVAHVVAPTYSDLRGVVFEGVSGLMSVVPKACIRSMSYSPYPELIFWNGSVIRGFSSETPDRLRGPQASILWGDELAAWYRGEECLSNIDFSTRIAYRHTDGRLIQPQKLYTTTPRPLQLLVNMIEKKRPDGSDATVLIRGTTYDNRDNLADAFFEDLIQYAGTRIGDQELNGILLDISESAIIKRSWLNIWPNDVPFPWLEFVMVSMDTAFTEKTYDKKTFTSDPTACTVWGAFMHEKEKGKGATWNLLLLDAWEEWLGFPDLITKARNVMIDTKFGRRTKTLFQPLVGSGFHQEQVKKADLLIIEDKGSGISLRQMLSKEGIDSFPYNPGRADKLGRLHAVSHLPRHGRIWLPETDAPNSRTTDIAGKLVMKPKTWADPVLKQLCVYSGPRTTPHDDWVDSCVVGSTTTVMGDGTKRNISDVREGDFVMTPLGPRRVLQAGATGVKPVYRLEWNSGHLDGTGNHPVWADGEWKRLDSLYPDAILQEWHSQENPEFELKSLSSMDTDIGDTPIRQMAHIVDILVARAIDFIAMCGSSITGLFRKAMMSIIMMMTPATTTFPIFDACPKPITRNTTASLGASGPARPSGLRTWTGFEERPKNGIVAKRVESGIDDMRLRAFTSRAWPSLSLSSRFLNFLVSGVKAFSKPSSSVGFSVAQPVKTPSHDTALVKRIRMKKGTRIVFNLRVEEAECYYANGVLVHNCSQAWRVFADRFISEGVSKRANPNDPFAGIIIPDNNPEFEYNFDVESGRATQQRVVAPYD